MSASAPSAWQRFRQSLKPDSGTGAGSARIGEPATRVRNAQRSTASACCNFGFMLSPAPFGTLFAPLRRRAWLRTPTGETRGPPAIVLVAGDCDLVQKNVSAPARLRRGVAMANLRQVDRTAPRTGHVVAAWSTVGPGDPERIELQTISATGRGGKPAALESTPINRAGGCGKLRFVPSSQRQALPI